MKRCLTLLALLCTLSAVAANWDIVRNGEITPQAFCDPSGWKKSSGGVTGTGAGNPMFVRELIDGKVFTITAKLSIDAWRGGAPRIAVGDVNCGFDGGKEYEFFVETDKVPATKMGKCANFITPGKPFTLQINGSSGTLTYSVDGKRLGSYQYAANKPLAIAINPWRANVTIYEFSVQGTGAGKLSNALPVPVCRRLIAVNRPGELPLPLANFAPGKYPAFFTSVNGKKLSGDFTIEIDSDSIAIVPAQALKTTYTAIGSDKKVRVAILQISTPGSDWLYRCRIALDDPEQKAVPATGKVVTRNGRNFFAVNGKEIGAFSGSTGLHTERIAAESLTRFGKTGINGVVFYDAVYKFIDADGNFDRIRYAKNLLAKMTEIVGRNPDAHFKIYFHLYMPPAWCKAHTQECIRLDNGKTSIDNTPERSLQPSYASKLWRKQMGDILAESIKIMQDSPFADRIPYLRLCYGNCGEWNNFGYHEQAYVDISEPMQNAFRTYLQAKYRTDDALRAAWGNTAVSLNDKSLVPTRTQRWLGGDFVRANGTQGMQSVDYYEFWQKYSAETVIYFAEIIKAASGNKMLAGAYFGYFFGHMGLNPYHFQDCGQYGVKYLLAAPAIDFIGGPYPYHLRLKSMAINGVVGSVNLAGKVWESEHDERTHHSGKRQLANGATSSLTESIAISRRNIMINLAAGSSFYYYDFIGDWYRDPEYMATIARMKEIECGLRAKAWHNPAKLAIIYSEDTVAYLTSKNQNKLIRQFNNFLNKEMPFLGIPFDTYYTSDLTKIDFDKYDAVLFPNCTFADEKLISDVKKFVAGNNRKLIFFHAPGIINTKNELDLRQSEKLTGIKISCDADATVGTVTGKFGKTNLPPVTFRTTITDPQAVTLGTWQDGTVAIAEKQFDNWKSIVICHHAPNIAMLRNLLNANGVRFWSSGRAGLNQCSFAGPIVSMYSRNAGNQTFWLPEKVEVAIDVFTGKVLAQNSSVVNFTTPAEPHTTVIFAGKAADYQQYFKGKEK